MKLYIPEIGDVIRLTQDWTFDLYNEDRNSTMMERMGDDRPVAYRWHNKNFSAIPVTVPAGAELKVDRIYIRKGKGDYSSITFLWVGERTNARVELRDPKLWGEAKTKIPRKAVRFWAKLTDVNNLEFDRA